MKDDRIRSLLLNILSDMGNAAVGVQKVDDDEYVPEFRWIPLISFSEDERKLIEQLADEEGTDFTTLTELI